MCAHSTESASTHHLQQIVSGRNPERADMTASAPDLFPVPDQVRRGSDLAKIRR